MTVIVILLFAFYRAFLAPLLLASAQRRRQRLPRSPLGRIQNLCNPHHSPACTPRSPAHKAALNAAGVDCLAHAQLVAEGAGKDLKTQAPRGDDLAYVMYTSGAPACVRHCTNAFRTSAGQREQVRTACT